MHRSLRFVAGIGAKSRLPGVAADQEAAVEQARELPIPHQVGPELKTRLQTEGEDTLRASETATVGANQMLFYRQRGVRAR